MKYIILILIILNAIKEGFMERGYRDKIYCRIRLFKINQFKVLSKFVGCWLWTGVAFFAYKCYKVGWSGNYILFAILFQLAIFNYVNALAAWRKTLLGTTSIIDILISIITFRQLWFYILITVLCFTIAIWYEKILLWI